VKLKLAVIISHHRWFVLTASGDTLRDTPSLASAWGFAEFLPSGTGQRGSSPSVFQKKTISEEKTTTTEISITTGILPRFFSIT
jgi:hypothetical protein